MNRHRRTLASLTKTLSGVGLHSGQESFLRVCPAPPGAGLVFCDTSSGQEIRALAANVTDTSRCTILGQGNRCWQTVEHLLSALHGLGVDDAVIEAPCGELPIMDGSAAPFAQLIQDAGLHDEPGTESAPIIVRRAFSVQGADGAVIAALPCETFRVTVTLDYPQHAYIGTTAASVDLSSGDYVSQVAPARTYGFVAELDWLRAHGLALGASRENAIALGSTDYETPLRFVNELARHKLLDVVGDLALAGQPIQAHVVAYKPGHALNVALAAALTVSAGGGVA